jgi:hypothetical protein
MSFDISRLRRADWIVGGGAVALFIFMFFFKWYGVSVSGTLPVGGVSTGSSSTGWDTFTNSRWIWLITIIVGLGSVVLLAGQRKLESPVQPSVIVAGFGAVATALIIYRIVHHPSASTSIGTFHASAGIKIGIWLGLIAAAAITYGGYLQMQGEGTSLSDVRAQAGEAFSAVTSPATPGSSGSSGGAAPSGSGGPAPTPPAPPPPAAPTPPSAPPIPPPAPPIPPPAAAPPGAGAPGDIPPPSQGV